MQVSVSMAGKKKKVFYEHKPCLSLECDCTLLCASYRIVHSNSNANNILTLTHRLLDLITSSSAILGFKVAFPQ
jgi:hypothetical protein